MGKHSENENKGFFIREGKHSNLIITVEIVTAMLKLLHNLIYLNTNYLSSLVAIHKLINSRLNFVAMPLYLGHY